MKVLSKRQILLLQKDLIAASGGIDGLRDEGLLDSAIHAPFQSFGGAELYPSLIEKAARLGIGLIRNHPFLDGNKRIGTHAMLVFLEINGAAIQYADDELVEVILAAASGTMDEADFLKWLKGSVA